MPTGGGLSTQEEGAHLEEAVADSHSFGVNAQAEETSIDVTNKQTNHIHGDEDLEALRSDDELTETNSKTTTAKPQSSNFVRLARALYNYDDNWERFRCWRYPRPRQIWLNGRNSAPHHRQASAFDLIFDLAIVIILARIGAVFRDSLTSSIKSEDRYNWSVVWSAISWNSNGSGAFQVFFRGFLILIVRWVRLTRFVNVFEQHDLIYEIFWVANIALFAIAGTTLSSAQVAPCFWGHTLFLGSVLGIDCILIAM